MDHSLQIDLGSYLKWQLAIADSELSVKWIFLYGLGLWVAYKIFIYPWLLSPLRSLPQPKGGYPIIGHALVRFKQPLGQEYLRWMKEVPNDGLIMFRDTFNSDHILPTSTEALSEVLGSKAYHFTKPPEVRQFTSRILGGGLLTTEGDFHKNQRRAITPSFTLRNTRGLGPLFWRKSHELVQTIALQAGLQKLSGADSAVVDMNHWATKVTLDIFGVAGLGLDLKMLQTPRHTLEVAYEGAFEGTTRKIFLYLASWCGLGDVIDQIPWNVDANFTTATDLLRRFLRECIQRRREEGKPNSDAADLLSKALATGKFSDDELVEYFLSFLTAGHETVASTFSWAIYSLASNPYIQSRLRDELRSRVSLDKWAGSSPDIGETLERLPFLNGVCNEIIRLYPSVPLSPRVAAQDTSVMNHQVPKGTRMMLATCALNRSPDLWGPHAEEFLPERWIDQETGQPNKYGGAANGHANMTFLHGAHSCIGAGYAKAELRTLVAVFVHSFEAELGNPELPVMPCGRLVAKPGDKNGQSLIKVRLIEGMAV